jgi:RimJ/RimL family protein N-acetyltransferase
MEADDAYVIANLGRHPAVFEHIPQISQPFDAQSWCAKAIGNPENYLRHLVLVGPTRAPVGYVQIGRRNNCDLELGYWLGKDYWHNGIGSAAAAAALILFTIAGGQPRIFAATTPSNAASRRILSKLGFSETDLSLPPDGMIDHVWEPQ